VGRYSCQKGKKVTTQKANEYCLIQRCPELIVNLKNKRSQRVIPIRLMDNFKGC